MYHTLQEVFVAQYDGYIAPHLVAVVLLEPGVYVSGLDVLCWCGYVGDILVLRHVVVDVFLRIAGKFVGIVLQILTDVMAGFILSLHIVLVVIPVEKGFVDITNIFVDGIFKIVGSDNLDGFESFLNRLETMSQNFEITFVISVSIDAETAPDYIKKLA